MAWIVRDYVCKKCGHKWEDLVDTKDQESDCPKCGTRNVHVISATPTAAYSARSPEMRAEVMRKRSEDHTKKWMKKDPSVLGHKA